MTNLISGKEAKLALANGEELEFYSPDLDLWFGLNDEPFMSDVFEKRPIRFKKRTITINGITVPKPQKNMPEKGDDVFTLDFTTNSGYISWRCQNSIHTFNGVWWRNENEIKQVVSALRKAFKGEIKC